MADTTKSKAAKKEAATSKRKPASAPSDDRFPELKDGYPDSYIQELESKDSFHLEAGSPITSLLTTGDYYQYRGPRYIIKEAGRHHVYNDYSRSLFTRLGVTYGQNLKGNEVPLYVWASKETWDDIAMFPEAGGKFPGERSNFYYLSESGQRFPYPWQAHHLLPETAFDEEYGCFKPPHRMVLERSFYNINNGHNLIMLPNQSKYTPVHSLIMHFGSHPAYTTQIKLRLKQLSALLDQAFNKARKTGDHAAPFKVMLKQLHALEEEFWNFLLKISQIAIDATLANTQADAISQHAGVFEYKTVSSKTKEAVEQLFGVLR